MPRLVWLIFVGYLIYNYNKKSFVQVYPQLIREFDFTKHDVGFISSSQQLSISMFTFLGGFLSDYYASSIVFPLGMIWCGLTTLLLPLGSSVNYFSLVWLLNGLGHGLELPTAMRLTKQMSTVDTYSTSWSLVLTSVNVAGVLNPLVTPFLASRYSWRVSLIVSGLVTLTSGLLVFYLLNVRTEQSTKHTLDHRKSKAKHSSWSGSRKFTTALVGVIMLNRFTVSFSRLSLSDWTQIYFINEKNIEPSRASWFVSNFEFVSICGKLFSGRLNDMLVRRLYPRFSTLSIRLPLVIVLHVLNAFSMWLYIHVIDSSSSTLSMLFISIMVGLFSSANVLTLSVLSSEIGQEKHEGFISSLCNLAAKMGGLCSGYPFTLVALWYNWDVSFTCLMLMAVLATICNAIVLAEAPKSTSKKMN